MAHWPLENPKAKQLATMVQDAITGNKQTIAMNYLESLERPERSGYSGPQGLFYAYLLAKRGYWRAALRQAKRLAKEGGPIARNPALLAIHGHALAKRLRYKEAWQPWLACAKTLWQQRREKHCVAINKGLNRQYNAYLALCFSSFRHYIASYGITIAHPPTLH